eukprot:4125721-Pleurochrysis_carterae.AAC.1
MDAVVESEPPYTTSALLPIWSRVSAIITIMRDDEAADVVLIYNFIVHSIPSLRSCERSQDVCV